MKILAIFASLSAVIVACRGSPLQSKRECSQETNIYISIIKDQDPSRGMGESMGHSVRYQITKSGIVRMSNASNSPNHGNITNDQETSKEESRHNPSPKQRFGLPHGNGTVFLKKIFRKSPKRTPGRDENDNEMKEFNDISHREPRQNSVRNATEDALLMVGHALSKEEGVNKSVNVYELILENNQILKELRGKGFKTDVICSDTTAPLSTVVQDIVSPLNRSESLLSAARKLGLHSFLRLLKASGLAEVLASRGQSMTLFAPTDEAFRNLPEESQLQLQDSRKLPSILLYHVTNGRTMKEEIDSGLLETLNSTRKIRTSRLGGTISIQGGEILTPNVEGLDGFIHSINTVLIPPSETLKDRLCNEDRLSTFLSLIKETDLTYLFNGSQAYTIFAPANEAFQKFPAEELKKLRESKRLLKAVLLYHIYGPGTLYSNNFQLGSIYRLRMLIRPSVVLQLRRKSGSEQLYLSQACKTLKTDILAINGVVHIVNTVLLPFGRDV